MSRLVVCSTLWLSIIGTLIVADCLQGQVDPVRCHFPAPAYETGTEPYSIAMGDLNNDGRADVVTAGGFFPHFFGTFTLHLSDANGTELRRIELFDTIGIESIVTGDLNGDSNLDVVAGDGFFGFIHILLGDGKGNLARSMIPADAVTRRFVDLGDLDGDGDLDIVSSSSDEMELQIFWNDGDGSFSQSQSLSLKRSPTWVATADFDIDGDPDVAVGNSNQDLVTIVENLGDMTFNEAAEYSVGGDPVSLTVADFNNDLLPDIATANFTTHDLSLLFNDGNGDFANEIRVPLGNYPCRLIARDVNSDANVDLLVITQGDDAVKLLMNAGAGNFVESASVPTGYSPSDIAAGDADGDGVDEFGVTHEYGNDFQILNITTEGIPESRQRYATGSSPRSIASGDLNGDGHKDVVTANFFGNSISVLINDGETTFSEHHDFPIGNRPRMIGLSDLDSDDDLDIFVTNGWVADSEGFLTLFINDGVGQFESQGPISIGQNPASILSEDLDDDGDMDLAITIGAYTVPGGLLVMLNEGDATFVQSGPYLIGDDPTQIIAADFNLDGTLDMAIDTEDGTFVLANSGLAEFDTLAIFPQLSLRTVGDVEGDGDPDLIGTTSIWLNDGSGNFVEDVSKKAVFWRVSDAVDIDSDGDIDLVGASSSTVYIRTNDGSGHFSDEQGYSAGTVVRDLAFTDLNNDQRLDILAADNDDHSISVILSLCTRLGDVNQDGTVNLLDVAPFVELVVSQSFQEEADVNGDGRVDLLDIDPFIQLLMN